MAIPTRALYCLFRFLAPPRRSSISRFMDGVIDAGIGPHAGVQVLGHCVHPGKHHSVGENQLPAFVRNRLDMTIAHTYKYIDRTAQLMVKAVAPERKQGIFDAQVDTLISIGEVTLKGSASVAGSVAYLGTDPTPASALALLVALLMGFVLLLQRLLAWRQGHLRPPAASPPVV